MIAYIPDHRDRAEEVMLSQDRTRAPRMVALVRALAGGAQVLEDIAFDLLLSNTIDTATGALLDRWGRFVREPRGGLDDDAYRLFIKARVAANLSEGTLSDLVAIFTTVTAPSTVQHFELYPRGLALVATRTELLDDAVRARVRRLLQDIKPGGVHLTLIEATPAAFTLDDPGPGYDEGELSRIL